MTVSIGNTVFASDHNTLRGEVNQWFGDQNPSMAFGNAAQTQGWGGSMDPIVSIGDLIEAADYNSLIDRCNIGTDIVNVVSGALTYVVAGNLIYAVDHNTIEAKSDSIFTNRNNIEVAEMSTGGAGSSARVANYSTAIDCTFRYTFSSFAKARYFWNSGGAVYISGDITGYTLGWGWDGQGVNQVLTNMGTIIMDYTSNNGTVPSIGFYDLTTAYQTIYSGAGAGAYTNTYINIGARYGGSGAYVELRATITPDPARTVDGTTTMRTAYRKLDNQSSGGASLSITAPAYSLINPL